MAGAMAPVPRPLLFLSAHLQPPPQGRTGHFSAAQDQTLKTGVFLVKTL